MIYDKTLSAKILERTPGIRQEVEKLGIYELLRKRSKTVTIDESLYYVVEGDLLLDEDELMVHAMQMDLDIKTTAIGITRHSDNDKLLGISNNGKLVRWTPAKILTYCVLKSTFNSESEYKLVVRNMRKATKDWELTCGIRFRHIKSLDNSTATRPEGVVFPVRGIDASGAFIASAFFPTYPKNRWRILIDRSYFGTSFNKVGVLRHELGHVLGLRHEHIRSGAPSLCPNEGLDDIVKLTDYDPKSVMHYFCGGVGSKQLKISEMDKVGAQKLYGPPFNNFDFIG